MLDHVRAFTRQIKCEIAVYRLVLADARTPLPAKIVLGAAIGYLLLPFDLIPDFIPVLGQLDDVLIVPGLVWLALLVEDARRKYHVSPRRSCRRYSA